MSGGSGAPGWTFAALGLDFTRFHAADAALVMQQAFDYADPNPHQAGYPRMSWSSNYRLPANGVMWSLFFGGRWLTPQFEVDGANVQDFLQGRYLAYVDQSPARLAGLSHVIGCESLNEPSIGWLGQGLSDRGVETPSPLAVGPALSPLDGLALARGSPRRCRSWVGGKRAGRASSASARSIRRASRSGGMARPCPFEAAGVYALRDGRAQPLDEEVFRRTAQARSMCPATSSRPSSRRWRRRPARTGPTGSCSPRSRWPVRSSAASIRRPCRQARSMRPTGTTWRTLTTKRFDVEDHVDALAGRRLHRRGRGPAVLRREYCGAEGPSRNPLEARR